jgi:hypothetical protein
LHLIRKLWLHIHVEHDRGDDSMDNI